MFPMIVRRLFAPCCSFDLQATSALRKTQLLQRAMKCVGRMQHFFKYQVALWKGYEKEKDAPPIAPVSKFRNQLLEIK